MFFLAAACWAGRCTERRIAWPWRRRRSIFFVSYCVAKTLNSVNFCLECPVFNALGAAVCRPNALPDAGPGDTPKGASPGLGGGADPFFLLPYCVDKTLKSVNFCLQRPTFNALGAAVCRPQSLARRWGGRRAERRVAWSWRRRQCKFLVSHHVAKC